MKLIKLLVTALILAGIQGCTSSKKAAKDEVEEINLDTIDIEVSRERPAYNPSATMINDLLHTRLQVSFDWERQYLFGKAHLTLKPYFYSTDSLTLDAKGFDIHRVALVQNDSQYAPLQYTYDSLQLHITLPQTYARTDTYKIFIDYTAKPNESAGKGSDAINSDKGLYFINPTGEKEDVPRQIWTQGETEASSRWFPTIDKPNERTTQEIYITVDTNFVTLSNGELVYSSLNKDGTRTDYWKMELPHAPYLFAMAIGEFAVVEDEWKGIAVDYYVEPEYEQYAREIFGNTPEMLTFYSELLGYRYPWNKYSQVVVRDFVAGAMENTTASIFFEGLQKTTRERLDETHEDIIAHELIHHWFGDLVTNESWANLPLNESFATYGEYLWQDYKYGRKEADYHIYKDLRAYMAQARYEQKPLIRYYYEDKEEMFDAHSYQKGGRVLHMLRNYVGDEAFFAALKHYLYENEYLPVEIHHLRLAFEEITGEDLNWFFSQWFLEEGHPKITVEYEFKPDENKAVVRMWQEHSTGKDLVYKLPLAVDIFAGNEVTREEIVFEEEFQEFTFSAPNIEWINVDAENILLAEIEDNKPTAHWVKQYYNTNLFLDKFEAIDSLAKVQGEKQEYKQVLVDALSDNFWVIRKAAVDRLIPDSSLNWKIASAAKSDSSSHVRAAAIAKLAEINAEEYKDIFLAAIDDPSYLVGSEALLALMDADLPQAYRQAKQMEGTSNKDFQNAIATVYATEANPEDHPYFEENFNKVSGWAKFMFITHYEKYLIRIQDPLIVEKGVQNLKDAATTENRWQVRYRAYLAIRNVMQIKEMAKESLERERTQYEAGSAEYAALERNIAEVSKELQIYQEMLEEVRRLERDERLSLIYKTSPE